MEPDGLRTPLRTVRTISIMLWRSRNEAGTGRLFRYSHRQSRWWDWVDGLCEPVGKTETTAEPEPADREVGYH